MENNIVEVENNTTRNSSRNSPAPNNMDEAVNLLVSWNLSQLCDKFREQEVCIEAFQHITDADIIQLVPKIGPRAIFNARLSEWRKKQHELKKQVDKNINGNKATTVFFASNNKNFIEATPVKIETMDAEDQWLHDAENMNESPESESLLETLSSAPNSTKHVAHEIEVLNESDFPPEEENNTTNNSSVNSQHNTRKQLELNSSFTSEVVNVKAILNSCFDGRKAIAYYLIHKKLDINHRKKVVKNVINVAVEKRINMTVSCFYNMAHQFVELFPNEKLDTYYMARTRTACPKGSLYNRYLNLSRRLRREGVLEYRIQRRRKHTNDNGKDKEFDASLQTQ